MVNKLALIDADGLVFMSSKDSLEESLLILNEKIQNIFDKTEATHYVFFISKGKYFRHDISKDYKNLRAKYPTKLKWLKTLKNYLIENWNAQSMDWVESDDLCSYFYNYPMKHYKTDFKEDGGIQEAICPESTFINDNQFHKEFPKYENNTIWSDVTKIICSPDKDLLQSIPGKHFNYTYKLEVKDDPSSVIKGWWVETNKIDAYKFQWIQMLMGDNADSIKCLDKVGEVKATKLINECNEGYSKFVLGKYVDHYQNEATAIYEFQKNYRLLHMLDCDSDFLREVGQIPEFPQIQQVIKPIVDEKIDF